MQKEGHKHQNVGKGKPTTLLKTQGKPLLREGKGYSKHNLRGAKNSQTVEESGEKGEKEGKPNF